jgi:predicted permease
MESAILAVAGGIVGVSVGGFALDWLKQLGAEKNQLWYPIELDARVLGAMLGIALLTSLVFGLAPALKTSRLDIRGVLNEAGRGVTGGRRNWTRGALVSAQVAMSLMLLIGAGLMVRTLVWLNGRNPGFDTQHVIAAEASLQDARYGTSAAVNRLYTQTLERLRRIPGVQSAAVALTLPYERPLNNAYRAPDGKDREEHTGRVIYTTPGYWETMRIPLLAGRSLRDTDAAQSAGVAVVSQSLAARIFEGADAVGRHIDLGGGPREIVGVCGDVQQHIGGGTDQGPFSVQPTLYIPVSQTKDGFLKVTHTWFSPKWVIRTSGPTAGLSGQIQTAVAEVDPQLPIASFRTVEQLRDLQTGSQRYLAALFSILAGLALLLAAIGLYGLISQSIAQRRHEIGIRLALGATVRQTIQGVTRPGILLSVAGIGAGLAMSLVAVRFLRSMLWGVRETDPVTFVATAAILLLVAVIATLLPALRILRMDPAETLRNE